LKALNTRVSKSALSTALGIIVGIFGVVAVIGYESYDSAQADRDLQRKSNAALILQLASDTGKLDTRLSIIDRRQTEIKEDINRGQTVIEQKLDIRLKLMERQQEEMRIDSKETNKMLEDIRRHIYRDDTSHRGRTPR